MREEWRTGLAEEKLAPLEVAYFRNRKSTWLIRSVHFHFNVSSESANYELVLNNNYIQQILARLECHTHMKRITSTTFRNSSSFNSSGAKVPFARLRFCKQSYHATTFTNEGSKAEHHPFNLLRILTYPLQGSAKRLWPGFVNAEGRSGKQE